MTRARRARLVPAAAALVGLAALAAPASPAAPAAPASSAAAKPATTAEVLAKYLEAIGGIDRWRGVSSMEWSGTEIAFSVPARFTLVRKRPNLYRFEHTVLKRPVVVAYDGATAWWNNPLMGAEWPVEIPPLEADITRRTAEFDPPLVDPEARGHRVELLGLDRLDGAEAYRLKVTRKDGSEETWFLDPGSYLPLAQFSPTADFGEPLEKRTYFAEYRKEGGLMLPHRVESEYGTRHVVLELDSVRLNVPVDEARFRMPPPEGMEALASLEGTWDVTIETRPDPRVPWSETKSASTITAHLGGRLLEERLDTTGRGGTDVIRTLSYDRFRQVYRVTQIDTFTGHLSVMEGKLEEARLIAGNETTGTTWSSGGQTFHARVRLYRIEADSFRLDTETSTDGGKTWFNDARYAYVRRGGS